MITNDRTEYIYRGSKFKSLVGTQSLSVLAHAAELRPRVVRNRVRSRCGGVFSSMEVIDDDLVPVRRAAPRPEGAIWRGEPGWSTSWFLRQRIVG